MLQSYKARQNSAGARELFERVQLTDQLQVHLLSTNREWFLHEATGKEIHMHAFLREEKAIKESIDELSKLPARGEELQIINRAKDTALKYLDIREELTKQNLPATVSYQKANIFLRNAYQSAAQLAQINLSKATDAAKLTQSSSEIMFLVAIGVLIVTMILLPFGGWEIRKWIYRPILNFKNQITVHGESMTSKIITPEGVTEIQEVAKAYNELIKKLDEQKKARFRFLAGVAHDLKNPLGAIKMSTQLLNTDDVSPNDRQEMTEIISRQTDQLTRMVGDFLDASRIESGQLELKKNPQDLRNLVRDSVLLHQKISDRHQFKMSFSPESVECNCDPMRISQVINNLLSNAIKYSPNGGNIQISVSTENAQAVLRVSDEGIGIAKEDQDKIFEPFQRTKLTKETIPGVGLGLSVSKHIIEKHGGSISIDSSVGQGTTFTIKLPLLKNKQQVAAARNNLEDHGKSL